MAYHLIYRELDELGCRTYHPPSNDDALAWATRLRNKGLAPAAAEARLLKATPAPVDGYFPTLAPEGSAPAGAVLQKLFASKDATVRAAAAATCSYGILGDETTKELAKLVSDPALEVRRAAILVLGKYAQLAL